MNSYKNLKMRLNAVAASALNIGREASLIEKEEFVLSMKEFSKLFIEIDRNRLEADNWIKKMEEAILKRNQKK